MGQAEEPGGTAQPHGQVDGSRRDEDSSGGVHFTTGGKDSTQCTHTYTSMHACTHMCMAQDIEEGTEDTWGKAAEKEEHSFPSGSAEVAGRPKPPLWLPPSLALGSCVL